LRVTQGYAPGKVILLGEHSVVYGRPAIAVPVTGVQAVVTVEDTGGQPGVTIYAQDIGQVIGVGDAAPTEPLSATVRNVLAQFDVPLESVRLSLTIRSSIPVASGMGSGAAVAAAIVRALSAHLNCPLGETAISSLVYETEVIHHGTPSGIDNTVVVFERPVYYRRGDPVLTFDVKRPFWLAIADTGVPSLTRETVADVRAIWQCDRDRCDRVFDRIGALVRAARQAIEEGRIDTLGQLMDENHALLCQLGVSSPELETLVGASRREGAYGAKLSGGGRGGNAIALIEPDDAERMTNVLSAAGAKSVHVTRVG
jgi:mevalonate kinase